MKFLCVIIACFVVVAGQTDSPVVSPPCGPIQGSASKSRSGVDFYEFKGIPYAEAPINDLRFKPPKAKSVFTTTFDGTKVAKMCYQPIASFVSLMDEDCLLLNVYTRNYSTTQRKSVIVYIHGGSYVIGSGSSLFVGPEYLMDRDIVLVTINYRLGMFGFLSTGTADAPGNTGFKDQVLALKWVKKNIKYFGGDPESITLFGQSAGARSVALHMVSKMSRGLFHRAIVMSGSTTAQWRVKSSQYDLAKKVADSLSCTNTSSPAAIVACLNAAPALDLAMTMNKFDEFDINPFLKIFPVIESQFGQERFLTDNPTKLFMAGRFHHVPVMVGVTRDEFVQNAYRILSNDVLRSQLDTDWNRLAPICFLYQDESTSRKLKISTALRARYLDGPLTLDSLDDLANIFSDAITTFGVHRFAHALAEQVPVYYYKSTYQGRFSHFYYPGNQVYGVAHVDDLQYVLYLKYLSPILSTADDEIDTVERMTRMWEYFAKAGNPNKRADDYLAQLRWKPLKLYEENYLNIGSELQEEHNLYMSRMNIWEKLFPLDCEPHEHKPKPHHKLNDEYPFLADYEWHSNVTTLEDRDDWDIPEVL